MRNWIRSHWARVAKTALGVSVAFAWKHRGFEPQSGHGVIGQAVVSALVGAWWSADRLHWDEFGWVGSSAEQAVGALGGLIAFGLLKFAVDVWRAPHSLLTDALAANETLKAQHPAVYQTLFDETREEVRQMHMKQYELVEEISKLRRDPAIVHNNLLAELDMLIDSARSKEVSADLAYVERLIAAVEATLRAHLSDRQFRIEQVELTNVCANAFRLQVRTPEGLEPVPSAVVSQMCTWLSDFRHLAKPGMMRSLDTPPIKHDT